MPSEYGKEIKSLALTKNLIVNSAEFDGEWVAHELQSGIIAVNPEFDYAVASVSLTPTLNIQSAEFDGEWLSDSATTGFPPDAAEFDYEVASVDNTYVATIGVQSSEYGSDVKSVNAAMAGLDVQSYDHAYEIMGGGPSTTVNVVSGEFDYELRPIFISAIVTDSAEFDYEALGGEELDQIHTISPGNAEFDYEALSFTFETAQYDHGYEVASVAIEQFSNATIIVSFEAGREWSAPILTQEYNFPGEGSDILSLEFDYEAQSGSFPGVPEIDGGEFDWEMPSPRFRYFLRQPKTPTHRRVQVRV